ncbi:Hypothetical protein FKW44_024024, partial [Caligus rogercresseyi]
KRLGRIVPLVTARASNKTLPPLRGAQPSSHKSPVLSSFSSSSSSNNSPLK